MKIRAIILSALILCGISAVIMYSRAAQPQQKSSVITQAINDKNTPMVIKNLILKMKEQMEVNDDQFPELIKEVENYTNSCADSAYIPCWRRCIRTTTNGTSGPSTKEPN
jgi:spore coat protein CotH